MQYFGRPDYTSARNLDRYKVDGQTRISIDKVSIRPTAELTQLPLFAIVSHTCRMTTRDSKTRRNSSIATKQLQQSFLH